MTKRKSKTLEWILVVRETAKCWGEVFVPVSRKRGIAALKEVEEVMGRHVG